MKKLLIGLAATSAMLTLEAQALALGDDGFRASRQLTCVLAEQSLGYLSEEEYGSKTRGVLDGFEGEERSNIYAKAIGYFDGLMFEIAESDERSVNARLKTFVTSSRCEDTVQRVSVSL